MKKMLNVEMLCRSFEDCLGWPYDPVGNDENGISGPGMFVRAFSLQDSKISKDIQTIWNDCLQTKGEISDIADLQKGYAVFNKDFSQIGLVTRIKPLCIVCASEASNRVRIDARSKDWKYWGSLKKVSYDVVDDLSPQKSMPSSIRALRFGDSGAAVRALHKLLKTAGFDVGNDEKNNIYGKDTVQAVRNFQRIAGITPNGVAGKQTICALIS